MPGEINPRIVYITCENIEQASAIGAKLVEEKLAACVNIIDQMRSIYLWEGKIEEGVEVILLAKTKESLIKPLTNRVKSLHSYTCPCVISLPILGGNADFIRWIDKETLSD